MNVTRYNKSFQLMEVGHWFIGRFGRPLWKHIRWVAGQSVG